MKKSIDTYGGHRDGNTGKNRTGRSYISWYMGRYSFVNVHQDAKSKTQEHRKIGEITRQRERRRKNERQSEEKRTYRRFQ